MSRLQVYLQQIANVLVAGSGIGYLVTKYLLDSDDPFSLGHPWQPHFQHLHVLFGPLLVFVTGLFWQRHVSERRPSSGSPLRSGLLLMFTFAPLVASGYLIQISVDPTWRRAWVWIHLCTAVLWILGYASHQIAGRRPQRVSGARPACPDDRP